jgi:hypothetical protein
MPKKPRRSSKQEITRAIWTLRDSGHAVVIFNPKELDGCPADELESNLVNEAWHQIDHIKDQLTAEGRE